ncbi:MAG: DUF933 domain-containing protein [Halanaerobiales bacterium]
MRADLAYNNLLLDGSLSNARDNGNLRVEGKNYIIKDGDVCTFRFNV